jgi:hypothetical protein
MHRSAANWERQSRCPLSPAQANITETRENHGFTVDHTWTISPKMVLELNVNLTAFRDTLSS